MSINTLDTNGYWKVGNTPIYVPNECEVSHSNVAGSSSGRDESGYMHIDWVRRDVRKVSLKYNVMTGEEVAYMENLMQGKEFNFTFLNDNVTATIAAYAGESSYSHLNYSSGEKRYKDFTINVIEM